jgi:fibronectin-binding autotransporter adhesin
MKHTAEFNVSLINEESTRSHTMKTITRTSGALLCAILMTLGLATAQAQTTANWIGPATGGEWNTDANWDTGFPPLDTTTNAFVGPGTNVNYDLPMAATSFGALTLQGVLNIDTNGFNNTGMLLNKVGGGAKVFVNTNGVVNVTGNFGIESNANLTIAPGGSITMSGNLNIGSDTSGGSSGGTSTVGGFGNVTNNGGTINAIATTFNPRNASLSSGNHALLVVNGGTNNLGNVDIHRPGGTSQAAIGVEGLVVNGGQVNMTSLRLGDNNFGSVILNPGALVTNTGNGTIRNSTPNRPSRVLQLGGIFTTVGSNTLTVPATAGNGVTFSVTGGTNYSGGFQFGDPAVLTSIGTVNFTNAASIFIGSSGMASNGAAAVNVWLNTGGRFAASTDWTNTASITLNGGVMDAEDDAGASHNIYSPGVFRGPGALIKIGGGTLTLAGSNTYSGSTFIQNGKLALAQDVSGSVGSIASSFIIVGSGTTFDVSQLPGYSVNAFQTLGGFGAVTGAVTVATNAIINPGSNAVTGTLTFNSDVIETNGAVNHFDVPGDSINIVGSLTASGTNTIEIAGGLTPGTPYALIHYGSFSGSADNFALTGATGTLSNSVADKTLYVVLASSLRANTNLTWVGNNLANDWDTHNLTNWIDGTTGPLDFFLSGDNVRFDNTAAANTNVNIPGVVSPASIVVDSTSNYVFSGAGNINGPITTLTKTNSGTLTLSITNTYAGVTTFGGGVVETLAIANSSVPSPIGAASSDPSFLAFSGGTLRYSGATADTDRGATFNTNAVIDVTNSATTLTLNGTLVGSGGLTKVGQGTLSLTAANAYTGVTTLSNGVLAVNAVTAISPNTINYAGGTLNLAASSSVQQFYANLNDVITTGTVIQNGANGNLILSGGWTGSGTMNIDLQTAGGTLTLNHDITTNFTGTIRLTDASTGTLRFNSGGSASAAQQCTGSPTVTFDLGNGSASLINRNGGGTSFGNYYLGALLGGPSTLLRGSANSGTLSTYFIGDKNLDTTFAGTIANGSTGPTTIVKVGTGTLTLTGNNTYGGSTVVSNGVLALGDGITDGSINSSTNITVASGAILDVSRRSDGTLQLGGQTLSGSGTVRGSVTVNGGGILSPGPANGIGTLTVTNVVTIFDTALMKLNHDSTPNSDRLVAPTINLGGTLVLTNIGAPLHAGDTFTLFQGTLSGSFSSILTPNYYTFDTTQVGVNGTVKVTSYTPPTMTADYSSFSSGTITFNAAGGIPGNAVSVLTSTNLSVPLTNWTAVATGNFDGAGAFTAPVTVDKTIPNQYYILSAQ